MRIHRGPGKRSIQIIEKNRLWSKVLRSLKVNFGNKGEKYDYYGYILEIIFLDLEKNGLKFVLNKVLNYDSFKL